MTSVTARSRCCVERTCAGAGTLCWVLVTGRWLYWIVVTDAVCLDVVLVNMSVDRLIGECVVVWVVVCQWDWTVKWLFSCVAGSCVCWWILFVCVSVRERQDFVDMHVSMCSPSRGDVVVLVLWSCASWCERVWQRSFPWCSGHHVCLTHRRSPVRTWAETCFSNNKQLSETYRHCDNIHQPHHTDSRFVNVYIDTAAPWPTRSHSRMCERMRTYTWLYLLSDNRTVTHTQSRIHPV